MVSLHQTASVGFTKAENLSPSWAKGLVRSLWSVIDKSGVLAFRGLYELQSQTSSWVMIYLVVFVSPTLAIQINIAWAILVTWIYWWYLHNGQPDLMETPPREGVSSFLATTFIWWANGWRQMLWKVFFGWTEALFSEGCGRWLIRKPVAYLGVIVFGVTPGHHLLKREGHSEKSILLLNTLSRIPNAFIKRWEIVFSIFITKWTWFLFWDYVPNPNLPL